MNAADRFIYGPDHDHSELTRYELTEAQQKVYNLLAINWSRKAVAGRLGKKVNAINVMVAEIRAKGWEI